MNWREIGFHSEARYCAMSSTLSTRSLDGILRLDDFSRASGRAGCRLVTGEYRLALPELIDMADAIGLDMAELVNLSQQQILAADIRTHATITQTPATEV